MNWWMILLIVVAAFVVLGLVIFFIAHILHQKKVKEAERKVDEKIESSTETLSLLFGGKENIKEIKSQGSRVSVRVNDIQKVEKDKMKEELESVMFMGDKIVFIIGSKSAEFEKMLQENINKQSK